MSFLNRKTKSVIKKNKLIRETLPYSKSSSIGILFTADTKEKFDYIRRFSDNLEYDDKQVKVLSYVAKGKENFEFKYDYFTSKDVSFWGNFKSDTVTNFINESFDYLYCVDLDPGNLVAHIMARSKAKCRIGIYSETYKNYFEMMINPKNERTVKKLIEEMYHFSKKFVDYGS